MRFHAIWGATIGAEAIIFQIQMLGLVVRLWVKTAEREGLV